ncbi:MAG: CpsD/CapB family tyrosine-protein kinase [Pseudomonadota bacterium]|nr:CpsD/CapB family tyrosine-protein kinase [Pseudomonadota bacterium]
MGEVFNKLELALHKQAMAQNFQHRQSPYVGQLGFSQIRTVQVPPATLRGNRLISGMPEEPITDMYRVLRRRVLHRLRQNNWVTLGITSACAGDGKTLNAINLGTSIALEPNYSVLLIDADLRRPSVHRFFELQPAAGLTDYLTSDTLKVEEVLVCPGIERLAILPCVTPSRHAAELLASRRMVDLISEIRTRWTFNVVMFNLPPVLVGDDVATLAGVLDAVLLVIADGQTRADELRRAMELMEGMNLLGTVLNKTDEMSKLIYDYYY